MRRQQQCWKWCIALLALSDRRLPSQVPLQSASLVRTHLALRLHLYVCWSPGPAATQVASRLFILWGIVDLAPEAHRKPLVVAQLGQTYLELSLLSLLVAWCCSEVIRYSFFAFKVRQFS